MGSEPVCVPAAPVCALFDICDVLGGAIPAAPGARDASELFTSGDTPPDILLTGLYRSRRCVFCDAFTFVFVCAAVFAQPCRISVFVPAAPVPALPGCCLPDVLYTPGGTALYLDLRGAVSAFPALPASPDISTEDLEDCRVTELTLPTPPNGAELFAPGWVSVCEPVCVRL
jgi:hypothetical protein